MKADSEVSPRGAGRQAVRKDSDPVTAGWSRDTGDETENGLLSQTSF